jgi:hypothetical protein
MAEIDLEALASAYDHRPPSVAALARAAAAADDAGLAAGMRALDAGGGRGAHAGVFAARGADAVVVDRSEAMAGSSVRVPGIRAVIGDLAALPFGSAVFDLVYFHLTIHYGDWRRNLAEAARVGRGSIWVWTLGSDHHRNSFLGRWFPGIVAIDERRFPEPGDVAAALTDLGLGGSAGGRCTERVERTAGSWRAAVEAGFVSTLQMIPAEELAAGLERFDATHPDPAEVIGYDLRFSWVRARHLSLR